MNLQEPTESDNIFLPRNIVVEFLETFNKMESLIATMEILADKETMKNLEDSKKDLAEGRFIEGKPEELEKMMNDDLLRE